MTRPLNKPITRRDFCNAAALGAGSALLAGCSPLARWTGRDVPPSWARPMVGDDWYGPGGVGAYASSHGNTPSLMTAAHAIRDGHFDDPDLADVTDTGETFDAIVVGAGMAGLGAAYRFSEQAAAGRCLVLDNHPIFGGESKENEFSVNGERLIAPQGANGFSIPDFANEAADFAGGDAYWYRQLGVPESFEYGALPEQREPLGFCGDHYGFIHWLQKEFSVGRQYRNASGYQLVRNPMRDDFSSAPIPPAQREALLNWLYRAGPQPRPDLDAWLDTMSYRQLLEDVLGLPRSVSEYIDPIIASGVGLGGDAVSAYACKNIALPGFAGVSHSTIGERHSFPGGNGGFARYFLKRLIPDAIEGRDEFGDIVTGRIRMAAMDRENQAVRIRHDATAVRVEHPDGGKRVAVTYAQGNRLYRVYARGVVMASGGWVNKRVVRDLPQAHRSAFESFTHAAFLVANVAVNNWNFMYKAGVSGVLYDEGLGFSCSIRKPMHAGSYRPSLDPDRPNVVTFYIPFYYPGLPAKAQGVRGRIELLSTSYADYEHRLLRQLEQLFGDTGFDAARDVEGIILNRWGHAYIAPEPGFYFGRGGAPAASDVIREAHGRIAFGHSELRGNQHWGPAAMEGRRAMDQIL